MRSQIHQRAAADVLARALPHATCFTIADLAEEFASTLRDDADWQEEVSVVGAVEKLPSSRVIAAHFEASGQRHAGSDKIEVDLLPNSPENPGVWWYRVRPVPGYTFLRFPLLETAAQEATGLVNGAPDPGVWRYLTRANALAS